MTSAPFAPALSVADFVLLILNAYLEVTPGLLRVFHVLNGSLARKHVQVNFFESTVFNHNHLDLSE